MNRGVRLVSAPVPTFSRILVLRGGALGDFVVTLPVLATLRAAYPRASIELIGNATAASLAVARGLLDRAYSQHLSRWAPLHSSEPLPPDLHQWVSSFDLVISYWPDPDRTLSQHFGRENRQTFLTASAMPMLAPAAAHYLAPLHALGLSRQALIQPLLPLSRPTASPDRRSAAPVALHPGSGSPRKNWPLERWIELAARLDCPLRIILGQAEAGIAERWRRDPRFANVTCCDEIRMVQNVGLEELIDQLHQCGCFIGHDSGVSHLAAACGLPTILLFGPTDPAMWAPPSPTCTVIRRGDDLTSVLVDDVLRAFSPARF